MTSQHTAAHATGDPRRDASTAAMVALADVDPLAAARALLARRDDRPIAIAEYGPAEVFAHVEGGRVVVAAYCGGERLATSWPAGVAAAGSHDIAPDADELGEAICTVAHLTDRRLTSERERRASVRSANTARARFRGPTRACRVPVLHLDGEALNFAAWACSVHSLLEIILDEAAGDGPRHDAARRLVHTPQFSTARAILGRVR